MAAGGDRFQAVRADMDSEQTGRLLLAISSTGGMDPEAVVNWGTVVAISALDKDGFSSEDVRRKFEDLKRKHEMKTLKLYIKYLEEFHRAVDKHVGPNTSKSTEPPK